MIFALTNSMVECRKIMSILDIACFLFPLTESHAAQASLKLNYISEDIPEFLILLLLPTKFWDFSHAPIYMILGTEPRASCTKANTVQLIFVLYVTFQSCFREQTDQKFMMVVFLNNNS